VGLEIVIASKRAGFSTPSTTDPCETTTVKDLTREPCLERNILEDDDGVLGGVLLQESLEVGRAGRQDHLVSLARLTVASQGDVGEGFLVPEVLERRDHVGLEVVPAETKLLLFLGHLFGLVSTERM